MVKNCKRVKMVQNDPIILQCFNMDQYCPNGSKWSDMVKIFPKWSDMVQIIEEKKIPKMTAVGVTAVGVTAVRNTFNSKQS